MTAHNPDLAALSLTACVAIVGATILYALVAPYTSWLRWDRVLGLALGVVGVAGMAYGVFRLVTGEDDKCGGL